MNRLSNYIGGEFVPPISNKYIENINPSTQQVNNVIPDSDSRDVENAIRAAQQAYPSWSKLSFAERAAYLDKIVAVMRDPKNFEELAVADSKDMGKPITLMKAADTPGAIARFEEYSRMIQSVTTSYYQMHDAVGIEHRNPIGITCLITPWNFPILLFAIKVSVALVCGNCCILKPSEITPTSAYIMTKLFAKCGLPPGVLNVVHGYGSKAGEPMVKHKAVRAVSFTGGSVTGKRISGIAAPLLKKLQLELGGKNASIVFDDCYLDETIEGVANGGFFNTGQVCCSGSRLLVQRSIADKFIQKLVQYVNRTFMQNIGDPMCESTQMGPLVSAQHLDKVKSYLQLVKQEGGRILCGGQYGQAVAKRLGMSSRLTNGNWFEPTIVVGLPNDCRCSMEEIFGPILVVHTFDTEQQVVEMANQVDYGLAACVWTSDIRRGQRVARQLEAGTVWLNTYLYGDSRMPFGGFKDSGVQREGGIYSIDFFTEVKSIVSKL